MNTRNLLWLLLPLLAACASSSAPYNKPKDAIRSEMAAAALTD